MNVVFAGHVDHGKSTVIGRLLADTGMIPEGKREQIRANCERTGKPFEYAFFIDALKDEQSQGITIDSARVFFNTARRNYIIIDAPGHIEFLKNMVTGASRADAAFLVIDASEGIRENTRRHGYLLSILGVRQVVVVVNKMDLAGYNRDVFDAIVADYSPFLSQIGIQLLTYIPVSGRQGDNIAGRTGNTPWYEGATVLEIFDALTDAGSSVLRPFRLPVQDVYKFSSFGDTRRIIAGTVLSGSVRSGDEILFFPSGKKSTIESIVTFNVPDKNEAGAGEATGITLTEQIYVARGEMAVRADEQGPHVTTLLRASLFWLGKEPFLKEREYMLKLGTARVPARLEKVTVTLGGESLSVHENADRIGRHEIAECILRLSRPIAFDTVDDCPMTGRFVIVDDYDIRGGGIVREALTDEQTWVRDKVFLRDYKWEKSIIHCEERAQRYDQNPALLIVTGQRDSGKKPIARRLERRLFSDGKLVYFLGIGNVLYGVDADIKNVSNRHEEHIRRLAEVANILLDAGIVLIVTAIELTHDDLEIIKTVVSPEMIYVAWVGRELTTDVRCDLIIHDAHDIDDAVARIKGLLEQ
jgi:bifunctional enzyme CysN/CysC